MPPFTEGFVKVVLHDIHEDSWAHHWCSWRLRACRTVTLCGNVSNRYRGRANIPWKVHDYRKIGALMPLPQDSWFLSVIQGALNFKRGPVGSHLYPAIDVYSLKNYKDSSCSREKSLMRIMNVSSSRFWNQAHGPIELHKLSCMDKGFYTVAQYFQQPCSVPPLSIDEKHSVSSWLGSPRPGKPLVGFPVRLHGQHPSAFFPHRLDALLAYGSMWPPASSLHDFVLVSWFLIVTDPVSQHAESTPYERESDWPRLSLVHYCP